MADFMIPGDLGPEAARTRTGTCRLPDPVAAAWRSDFVALGVGHLLIRSRSRRVSAELEAARVRVWLPAAGQTQGRDVPSARLRAAVLEAPVG